MKQVIAIMLVMMLTVGAALAMPVRTASDPVTVAAAKAGETGEAEETSLTLSQFHLLGTDESGNWIVFVDGQFYSVSPSSLPMTDIEAVPGISEYQSVSKGSKGDAAMRVQQMLIDFGYLAGTADGDFGKKSEDAVKAFQAANGLEETGVADPMLQMLMTSMTQPEIEFAPEDLASAYLALSEKVGIDLQSMLDSGLSVDYDEMAGEIFISDGKALSFDKSGEADIDKYIVTVQFGLSATILEDGSVEKKPVVRVGCLSLQRPVISEVTVKSGDHRGTAAIEGVTTSLDGIQILEEGAAVLDAHMLDALAGAEENGELKVRVKGQYKTFDVQVPKDRLAGLSKLGAMLKG